MKKRTAFIGAILSLIPLGQPLLIKTGLFLTSSAILLSVSENAYARDASYYFDRAFDKAENGNHKGAISDYTKSIELDPNESVSYYNRALSKYDMEDFYGAISDNTKAIKIDPEYADAYYNRALAKEGIEDYSGAISDYTKTIEIDSNYAGAYNNRGN